MLRRAIHAPARAPAPPSGSSSRSRDAPSTLIEKKRRPRGWSGVALALALAGCGEERGPAGRATTEASGAALTPAVPDAPSESAALPTSACAAEGAIPESALRVREDLVYAPQDGWSRRLDLALPPGEGPHPLVLLFHGGGWANGDEDQLRGAIRRLARHGYAAASASYRLANAPAPRRFPAAVSDARCVLRFLARRAEIDPERVVSGGVSAGGHLAAMLAVAERSAGPLDDGSCPFAEELPSLRGAMAFYAPLDLREVAPIGAYCHRIVDNFVGSASPRERRLGSPIALVDAEDPPFLLVHGSADEVVNPAMSRAMARALAAVGVPVTHLEVPAMGHGVRLLDPGRRRRVTCTTLAFLEARLRSSRSPSDDRP